MTMAGVEDIAVTAPADGVRQIALDRPKVRNALRTQTLREIAAALGDWAGDDAVHCVVVTGGETVFAAGADIKEMAAKDAVDVLLDERPRHWQAIREFPKPLVAAVNCYALGGGCELAMHCDVIVAGEGAHFGQPEVNLGLIPGGGGTQRLTRALGKAKAMQVVLAAEFLTAAEAVDAGLVGEVVPDGDTLARALAIAGTIAAKPPLAVRLAKEAVLKAWELPLAEGLAHERRAYTLLFSTDDRREGVAAFLEKRPPRFTGR